MRIALVFLLFATSNWVLAAEPPYPFDVGDTSSTAPPTGEGDNSDLILSLVIQLTKDMKGVKADISEIKGDVSDLKEDLGDLQEDVGDLQEDLGEVKVNQAVLQQDVSTLKGDVSELKLSSAVSSAKMTQLESQVEGNKHINLLILSLRQSLSRLRLFHKTFWAQFDVWGIESKYI